MAVEVTDTVGIAILGHLRESGWEIRLDEMYYGMRYWCSHEPGPTFLLSFDQPDWLTIFSPKVQRFRGDLKSLLDIEFSDPTFFEQLDEFMSA